MDFEPRRCPKCGKFIFGTTCFICNEKDIELINEMPEFFKDIFKEFK